ncbi:trafficking protein particle complex subunit 13 [Cryptosporidium felis]|nr:trafficking protein particle complex subunit 13 [Cryptosporidium felis]
MNIVIKERVDEVGFYSLVCQLFFTSNETRLAQKKSYKFAVFTPFNISHRIFNQNCSDTPSPSFLEVSLENTSHQSLTLTGVRLEPLNLGELSHLSCEVQDVILNPQNNEEPIFIKTKCRFNKIFKVAFYPNPTTGSPSKIEDKEKTLKFQLKVCWVSRSYGEAWIDSYFVDLQIPPELKFLEKELRLTLRADIPAVSNRQNEFKALLHVTNNLEETQKNLSVKFNFDELLPIVVLGNDSLKIDFLEIGETKVLELKCRALVSGVHSFVGVCLLDGSDGSETPKPFSSKN